MHTRRVSETKEGQDESVKPEERWKKNSIEDQLKEEKKNHQKIRRNDKLAWGKTSNWKYWEEKEIFLKVIVFIEKNNRLYGSFVEVLTLKFEHGFKKKKPPRGKKITKQY